MGQNDEKPQIMKKVFNFSFRQKLHLLKPKNESLFGGITN
jgi:hypothetical protein